MKIQKCTICEKPFFPEITTTGEIANLDPTACNQCNAKARENSQAPIDNNKTF